LKNKIKRLLTSKNYLSLISFYHNFFGEKFRKDIPVPKIFDNKIHRLSIINKIINDFQIKNYLEIGCDQDEVFSKVIVENKVGVDPVNGGNVRSTSDEFFKKNSDFFDLIFIDGLHEYAQVKKDIINGLEALNPKGVILIHDCMPLSYLDQAVPRGQRKWNGDVWKSIVEFRTRNDVFTCVGCFDQGIGMILKRKNDQLLELSRDNNFRFKDLSYENYYYNFDKYLNLIDHNKFFELIKNYKIS
tara:strand:- start:1046 stop:1777 length:732 start_codon:yes stop_codon:yes gene_type:complete